ncbi:MAG: hypothetical protein MI922_10850 [Bacteroidales bacterium]|nr:hypothetical protein [Bacteroidales bacterium]
MMKYRESKLLENLIHALIFAGWNQVLIVDIIANYLGERLKTGEITESECRETVTDMTDFIEQMSVNPFVILNNQIDMKSK